MATERIWDIQGFSGGESDDIYKGPKDSFYFGENIDVRKDLSSLQLGAKLVDLGWSIDGTITAFDNLETLGVGTTSGVITCTANGKVYLNGALKQTINTGTANWNVIIGIGVISISGVQYVYYVTKASAGEIKIHRSTTDLNTWNISYKSFTVSAVTPAPERAFLISNGAYLYIAVKNKVVTLYSVGEILEDGLELPDKEIITGFTQFQDTYKIYSNIGSNGVQYYWDGTSDFSEYRQVWYNQPILGVVNDGAMDYAILGFNSTYSALYIIQGTQKQELRVNLEASASSRILEGYLSIRKGMVYISGGKAGESNNYGVYTYGSYYPGTPKSLVQEYSLSTNAFLFHCHSTGESYFANSDNKVYRIEQNNPPTTLGVASTGYVVTNIYQGNIWEEKKFKKMKIGFKIPAGTDIKIYLRTSIGESWDLIKTINNTNYSGKKYCTISANEILSSSIGSFNELQMKIELNGSTYFSPKVQRITTWLEVVNFI